ncbi:MAG: hypothetical protein IJF92_01990 [Bacilli bacterium]|nr:hypothetical protein [Bacilli bacterium]
MLEYTTEINKGIMFIRLEGELNNNTFINLYNELEYLLYRQGIHYYVFNFKYLKILDQNIFIKIQNILTEIFLSCGQVVMCGLKNIWKKRLGSYYNKLFYVNNEVDAFKYLKI